MEYDFGIMMSDVTEKGIITLEIGVKPNGNPIYRVAVYDGNQWTGARYGTLKTAITTYRFLKRVI